jgi:hypothetical protein
MSASSAQERVAELQRRLADAQGRMPKHSLPMVLMMEIEELEEELEAALAQARQQALVHPSDDAASHG